MTSISRTIRKAGAMLACAISIAGLGACLPAHAAGYPGKPIRFIVPYPPGGGTDIVARLLAEKMQHDLGQPVLVENKSGASTVIGTEALARAEPDGYTIGLVTDSHILNPFFKTDLPYDSVKDFQPVSQLTLVTLMLVANPKLHVKSLKELIALARSEPGKLSYASIGTGTPHEIAMEWLKSMAKINLIEVPYRGVAPALSNVVGGQVDVMFTGTSSAKPFIDSGKLVPLAVSSAQRLPSFPDIPTVAEAGLPGYDMVTWYGVLAPAGTPPGIVDTLSREFASALKLPDVKKRLDTLGVVAAPSTPEAFGEFMKGQSEKMARIVKETGLKAK
jgi:tripartite-type tricarboxylate transporter receptor subunit TctC